MKRQNNFSLTGGCVDRSSRLYMFFKIGVLRNLSIFTETPVLESLFKKVAGL